MFKWLRSKKDLVLEIETLKAKVAVADIRVRNLERKLDQANLQLSGLLAVRKAKPPIPVTRTTSKVDHRPWKANTYGSSETSSPSPRAGHDPEPSAALTNLALGVGAGLLISSLTDDSSPSHSTNCSNDSNSSSSSDISSGGGGDFGGGGASSSWD